MPPVVHVAAECSVADLAALAPKAANSYTGEDVLRLLATASSVFVDLVSVAGADILPAHSLKLMMHMLLVVPKRWVWHSMTDSVRLSLAKAVNKHKALDLSF